MGISIDELEETARKNTHLLRPAQIIPINQVLMDNGIAVGDCPDMDLLVVTNQRKWFLALLRKDMKEYPEDKEAKETLLVKIINRL